MVTTPTPAEVPEHRREPERGREAERRTDPERRRDPERTRREILDVATREFAQMGYAGARVDEIAAQTRTTKRMIYYYFGGKEKLYIAVLERAYAAARAAEQDVDVDHLDPVTAIRQLAELTFDHHQSHPDFIRLVSIENVHQAQFMAKSAALAQLNTTAVTLISKILAKGYAEGVFARQADPLDVHLIISSFCFFRAANRYTWRALFGRDPLDRALRDRYRQMVGDLVVSYLTDESCPASPR
jgi:AcrR family transcriptional regulator